MGSGREEKLIFGLCPFADFSAWATRIPSLPSPHGEWSVFVKFGDSGFECDPGIYGEPVNVAIEYVEGALEELEGMYHALKNFQLNERLPNA